MAKKVTLHDVAQAAGVTVGTVHKALNGHKGVSEEKRAEILRIAGTLHYCEAVAPVQRELRVAAVFPKPVYENKYFYKGMWQGIRERAQELEPFHFTLEEYTFEGGAAEQIHLLEKLYDTRRGALDALITVIWDERACAELIDRFAEAGVEVFTVSADAPASRRVSAIRTDPYRTGRLAAEFLGARIAPNGRVILIGTRRDTVNHAQIVRGFFDEMLETNPSTEIIELYESVHYPEKLYETALEFLHSFDNIRGIYANNARCTAGMCNALKRTGLAAGSLPVVGSDLFAESAAYLRTGLLCAIIDQNAYRQGYLGVSAVFDHMALGKATPAVYDVAPALLLRSNLPKDLL